MLCTREVTVQVPDGLHHQTAARFIQTANRFTSVVRVVYGDNNVNAKSLLGVLSLSIGAGTRITITADGADAGEALDALVPGLAGGCPFGPHLISLNNVGPPPTPAAPLYRNARGPDRHPVPAHSEIDRLTSVSLPSPPGRPSRPSCPRNT